MSYTKTRTNPIAPCLASLLLLFLSDFPMQALAQQSNPQVSEQLERTQTTAQLAPPSTQAQLPTPSIQKRSGRRKPASPRGPCSPTEKSLTALIPETNLGLTVAAYPTFFFYVPQTPVKNVEFVLIDEENDTHVYETTFTIIGTPGIVSISLPASETLPPLKIGKDYHWYLSMICDPKDRSGDIYVDGWVQRVEPNPDLMSELEKSTPRDRPAFYGKNDLWYDTLTNLAEQRRLNPNDSRLATKWTTLLNSVGLDNIAQEPLIQP